MGDARLNLILSLTLLTAGFIFWQVKWLSIILFVLGAVVGWAGSRRS